MAERLRERLFGDVRIAEGLNACMNCGICTAVCPAAEYFEYDPRSIAVAVQTGGNEELALLLRSDTIWYCGQCMSCKPRCPRNNCPGLIVSALRKLSQETGAFIESRFGRQQYLLIGSIGENIRMYGYCVHPSAVVPGEHPEQGPVWEWVYNNMKTVYPAVGANLYGEGAGAMRLIAAEDIGELNGIFQVSGGQQLWETIEKYSAQKAISLGFTDFNGHADMGTYRQWLLNNEER